MPDTTTPIRPSVPIADVPKADLTTPAALDRSLHVWQSRFTGGWSPSTVALACLDWAAHAANTPFQTADLGRTAMAQCARLMRAAGQAPGQTGR
jgi:polyhydroxyalkanoate synthase